MEALERMLQEQLKLGDEIFAKQQDHPHMKDTPPSLRETCELPWTDPVRQRWIGNMILATQAELGELLEGTGWKWWRPVEAQAAPDGDSEEAQRKAQVEWADLMHFMLSLGLLLGMDSVQKIQDVYFGKMQVNHLRQEDGYAEKTPDDLHVKPGGKT